MDFYESIFNDFFVVFIPKIILIGFITGLYCIIICIVTFTWINYNDSVLLKKYDIQMALNCRELFQAPICKIF